MLSRPWKRNNNWVLDASIQDLAAKLRAQIIKNISERIPLIPIAVEKIFIAIDLSIARHFNFAKSSLFFYLFIYFFFPFCLFFFSEKKKNCFYVVFQPFFTFYFELVSSMRFKNPCTIDFDVVQTFSGLNLLIQGICKHVAKIFRMYVRKFSKRALPPSPELDLPFDEMVHPN